MPADAAAKGTIPSSLLTQATNLFDEAFNSFDPASPPRKRALRSFDSLTLLIYHTHVHPAHPSLNLSDFAAYLRDYCRRGLRRKNQ